MGHTHKEIPADQDRPTGNRRHQIGIGNGRPRHPLDTGHDGQQDFGTVTKDQHHTGLKHHRQDQGRDFNFHVIALERAHDQLVLGQPHQPAHNARQKNPGEFGLAHHLRELEINIAADHFAGTQLGRVNLVLAYSNG